MPASITFAGYVFTDQGLPQWEQRNEYEAAQGAIPRIRRTTYTISQLFDEQSYADNEARIHLLLTALEAGQGTLVINDENGTALINEVVNVKSNNVPKGWRQYFAEMTVVFEGRSQIDSANAQIPAVFTPTGGAPVTLPNVTDWKIGLRVSRYSNQVSNRDEAIETITATGFILADQALPVPDRLAYLQQQLAALRTCNAKDGALQWGTFAGAENRIVRVETLDGVMGDGTDRLNWSLVAFYKSFPSGSYAQPEYTLSQKHDYVTAELVLGVRGKVKADTQSSACAAVAQIKAQYVTATRELDTDEVSDNLLAGVDGAAWVELSFNFEFREPLPKFSYKLKVNTKSDARTGDVTTVYEGEVAGSTIAAALAQARLLGLNQMPFIVSSTETVSTQQLNASAVRFTQVAFSYEYLSKGVWQYAEVTSEVNGDPFSDAHQTITGFVAAADLPTAQALAATFQLNGRLMRDQKTSSVARTLVNAAITTQQVAKFDFTWVYYVTPVAVSVAYGREETTDWLAIEQTTTFSGVARGPSEAACRNAITGIVTGNYGAVIVSTRKPEFEQQNGSNVNGSGGVGNQFLSMSFTEKYTAVATGSPGIDVIKADVHVKTKFSVNEAAIANIPYGTPFAQPGVGFGQGSRNVSGTVLARTAAGAQAWGKGCRPLMGTGGYESSPDEDAGTEYAPLKPTTPQKHTFGFSYTMKFAYLPYS